MTEDDTFKKLRGYTLLEAHVELHKFRTGMESRGREVLQGDAIEFLKTINWDYFDFVDQWNDQFRK